MLIQEDMSLLEKLGILADAAKYDVACTSSGADRRNRPGSLGNAVSAGLCHSFAADGRCISLLKILFTNQCVYDCKYCLNRRSNDVPRAAFTPEEVCRLTIGFYKRNYIEGLFLSSGVFKSPDYTMDLMYQTLWKLRYEYRFNGYVHIKAIPGADPVLIEQVGYLADRMSVNLELPTAEGLRNLAPSKTRSRILAPMRQIQRGIHARRQELPVYSPGRTVAAPVYAGQVGEEVKAPVLYGSSGSKGIIRGGSRHFVPAGQSTQMIVGATPENDFQMLTVAEALYKNYELKRVFYSAFVRVNDDSSLPALPGGPPLLREHRLYQADWLLRFYGFQAGELLTEEQPNFNLFLDPKCDWALRHLELFPMDVQTAEYGMLLRIPGVGVRSAKRILAARRSAVLDFPDLKKMGVVLKRAQYFITCKGRMLYPVRIDQDFITSQLVSDEKRGLLDIGQKDSYRQLSMFDDGFLPLTPTKEDIRTAALGQM